MSPFSPQQLRSKAHQLMSAWVVLHNNPDDNAVWEQRFPLVNEILEEVAQREQLDAFLKVAFDEALEHYAERLELDEENAEPYSVFHDFVMAHLTSSVKVEDHDGTIVANHVQIGGVPLFGHYGVLRELIEDPRFPQIIIESGIVPSNAHLVVLGMAPIGIAQMYSLFAQQTHQTVRELATLLPQLDQPHAQQRLGEIAHEWDLDFTPPDNNPSTVSGFVAVFAYSAVCNLEDTPPSLRTTSEHSMERWEELRDSWVGQLPNSEMVVQQHIGGPHPLREAIAVTMADFALQNMFLQHSIGGAETEIARIEVVAPWSEDEEANADHFVEIGDRTTVYGFSADNQMMGVVTFNSMVLSLLFSEIAHCWESWVDVQPTFYNRDEHRGEHPTAFRVLH